MAETNSFQKQKVLNNPTKRVEAEGSAKVLFFHSLTFQQSSLSNFEAAEGGCFYLSRFRSIK